MHDPYCLYTGIKLLKICDCRLCLPSSSSCSPPAAVSSSPLSHSHVGEGIEYYPQQAVMAPFGGSEEHAADLTLAGAVMELHKNRQQQQALTLYPQPAHQQQQQQDQHHLTEEAAPAEHDVVTTTSSTDLENKKDMVVFTPAPAAGTCFGGHSRSTFIPPAPPNVAAFKLKMEKGEEGSSSSGSEDRYDEDFILSKLYGIFARWFSRIEETQSKFLSSSSEFCPIFEKFHTFEEWSFACHRWWMVHFSEKQKKYKPLPASKRGVVGTSANEDNSLRKLDLEGSKQEKNKKKKKKRVSNM